jgi:hypothetical protein
MANKHMKTYSASSGIRHCDFKHQGNTNTYLLATADAVKSVEQWDPSSIASGNTNGTAILEVSMEVSTKIGRVICYTPDVYHNELRIYVHTKT